ncbi:MAG TPA: DUF3311 domain-containing protein [Solirubrobacteraceae bacterium]|jgi:hypothetical protein|nr:DUF3311 domain-containing protein [Solirubrobacteraceae bacterium]
MAGHPRGEGDAAPPSRRRRGYYWLLLLPFAGLLYPPLYAHANPHLWGIPFFYWYQVVWLGVTAAISTLVYRNTG